MNKIELARNIVFGGIYLFVFDFVYRNFMYEYFSYISCPNPDPMDDYYLEYILCSIIPLFFYKGFVNISSAISFFIYILIYIPMTYVTYITDIAPFNRQMCVVFLLLIMVLFFISDGIYLLTDGWFNTRKKYPIKVVEIMTLCIFLVIMSFEIRNLSFVNILSERDEMYDLRSVHGSQRIGFIQYLLSWIRTAFLPLLLVYYLKNKHLCKYVCAFIMYIFIFMIDMQRITFIMPYLITIAYFIAYKFPFSKYFSTCIFLFFSIISSLLLLFVENTTIFSIAAVFIMRTQCLDAWLFNMYLDFFEHNPYTYYSHVNIVNAIFQSYPYNMPLGNVVSNGSMNANASFLITDGYAAMGYVGFLFIGFIFIILKSIFNGIGLVYEKKYIIIILMPAISSMLNVSLFTAIFSCGFLILYFLLKYIDIEPLELNEEYPPA